jgi:hypothetical protein
MTTLLAHIAGLIGNREDVATKGLHFLLTRSEEARRRMQAVVRAGQPALPDVAHYEFQPGGRDGEGRPDMRGVTGEGTTPLLIESKIWAGLTAHQPATYLQRLPEQGVLLFIAPSTRVQPLSWDLDERLQKQGEPTAVWARGSIMPSVLWRSAGIGKVIAIIAWQELLDNLKSAIGSVSGSEVTSADVDQLRGFIDVACGSTEPFLPFLPEQVTGREIPQLLASVATVVDRAIDIAIQELGFERKRSSKEFDAYGAELELNGITVWFGYYRQAWAFFAASPIWLEVWQGNPKSHAVFEVLATIAGKSANVLELPGEKSWYVPLTLTTQEHEDVVVQNLTGTLDRLRRGLAGL